MISKLLFTTAISICFTLNLFGQSNNIKTDIDKNGISDLFSYDDNSIKVLLNGKKLVQKIEKFGYENVTDFKVENGVFTFAVNCGMCTGQYTYTYKLKVVNGNLKLIGYDLDYKYAGSTPGYVNKSFNLTTKKYIVSVHEFNVDENKGSERKEVGVFKLSDIYFNSYTETSLNSLEKYGSKIEPK
jgi:hypothetical protein